MDRTSFSQLLGELSPSKSVVMKPLYVEDYEFQPSEVRYLAHHDLGLFALCALLKIRTHPVPEGHGFADVDHVPLGVFHYIDSR